jgi:hypothetical protein
VRYVSRDKLLDAKLTTISARQVDVERGLAGVAQASLEYQPACAIKPASPTLPPRAKDGRDEGRRRASARIPYLTNHFAALRSAFLRRGTDRHSPRLQPHFQRTARLHSGLTSSEVRLTSGSAITFHIGAAAAGASDRIIYNSVTGGLDYDADGTGGTAAIRLAALGAGLALTSADFFVI